MGRRLALLSLLESGQVWSGPELAERLKVTTRTVRRDVDQLREMGYAVNSDVGVLGGYRLRAGKALPPLMLDSGEAVAVAVALQLTARCSVGGVDERAMQALVKLNQMLPSALRSQVESVSTATVTVGSTDAAIDQETLLTVADAVSQRCRIRFDYTSHSGSSTRDVEPYRLVNRGTRWYLIAFDVDRDDWRLFRLDRASALRPSTFRYRPRSEPDPETFLTDRIASIPYPCVGSVRFGAPADRVRRFVPATIGDVTPDGVADCLFTAGASDWRELARHMLAIALRLDCPMSVSEPAALLQAVRSLTAELSAGVE